MDSPWEHEINLLKMATDVQRLKGQVAALESQVEQLCERLARAEKVTMMHTPIGPGCAGGWFEKHPPDGICNSPKVDAEVLNRVLEGLEAHQRFMAK